MAAAVKFKDWLDEKLRELNTDENIFGSYIQSILDGDDSSEEKSEGLQGIISEIIDNDVEITKLCQEILEKWRLNQPKELPPAVPSSEEINEKLAKLLECQLPTAKQKQYTAEEKKIREAILSQYSQMTDSEEEETDIGDNAGAKEKDNLEKNVNAQLVADAVKQKRENAKIESQKKKEKDKEDREKQKNLKEEKKEKRKTQKGERRR